MSLPLGRRAPTDWEHVDKYPLTARFLEEILTPRPVVLGINWYTNFDRPEQDSNGKYWIGRSSNLGSIRGGHCVALQPYGVADNLNWWSFYDQGSEGACVGFGSSRMMTLMNRKRYFARWLWDRSKEIDEWSDTNPGDADGTSVRAALDVLRTKGHVPWRDLEAYRAMNTDGEGSDWIARAKLTPVVSEGISANRWIRSMDDMIQVLGQGKRSYCVVLNSWGTSYPRYVRIPITTLERLWNEDGEFGVPTDR